MTIELKILYAIAFFTMGALTTTVFPPVQHWPKMDERILLKP